jgi:hypothetical protein
MSARLMTLCQRLLNVVPYVYATLLGMMLQQLIGGAK